MSCLKSTVRTRVSSGFLLGIALCLAGCPTEVYEVDPVDGGECVALQPATGDADIRLPLRFAGFSTDDGFDLDGHNDAPPNSPGGGRGATVEGCWSDDSVRGVDSSFDEYADDVEDVVPLADAIVGAFGGPNGMSLVVSGLDDPAAARDDCVTVTASLGAGGSTAALGRLTHHVLDVRFASPLVMSMWMRPESGRCGEAPCVYAALRVSIHVERIVARLTNDNRSIVGDGAILGGYFAVEGEEIDLNSAFTAYAKESRLDDVSLTTLLGTLAGRADLRLEGGSIVPCRVDAGPNAISFAWRFGSR